MKRICLLLICLSFITAVPNAVSAMSTTTGYRQTVPFIYDDARNFSEGMAAVELDGKWGFIDKSGEVVIPFEYDYAISFSEGMAAVEHDGKWGFMDKSGEAVIPFEYDDAISFSEGMAAVMIKEFTDDIWIYKWGFIDKEGNCVILPIYDKVLPFSEGFAAVSIRDCNTGAGRWGFVDMQGNVVIPYIYDDAMPFKEGLAAVSNGGEVVNDNGNVYTRNSTWGFFNLEGSVAIPFQYKAVFLGGFNYGVAMVSYDFNYSGTYGYINKEGVEVTPFTEEIEYYYFQDGGSDNFYIYDGLISFKQGDLFGFTDIDGNEVIPAIYEKVTSFSDGVARVFRDGSWRIIDKTGYETTILNIENYSQVILFFDGMAAVRGLGGWSDYTSWGFIDKDGNEIIPPIYDTFIGHSAVTPKFYNGFVVMQYNEKVGVLDKNGNIVVPFEYDFINEPIVSDGMLAVAQLTEDSYLKWGYLSITGNRHDLQTGGGIYDSYTLCNEPVYDMYEISHTDENGVTDYDLTVYHYDFPLGTVEAAKNQMLLMANGEFMPFIPEIIEGRAYIPIDYVGLVFGVDFQTEDSVTLSKLNTIAEQCIDGQIYIPVRSAAEILGYTVGYDIEITSNPVVWVDEINEEWEVDLEALKEKCRQALEILKETIETGNIEFFAALKDSDFALTTLAHIAEMIENIEYDRHIGRYAVITGLHRMMLIDNEGNVYYQEGIAGEEGIYKADFQSPWFFSRFFHS